MKTKFLSKGIVLMVMTFLFSLAASAVSPKNYLYDTKQENGKIISKVVFLQENGFLNKNVKYEFSYNAQGKVAEKLAYRWDAVSEQWTPFYKIQYQYVGNDIKSTYGMWNQKKKDYTLNIQEMTIPAENYEEIFS
jgi:hypothetical protein